MLWALYMVGELSIRVSLSLVNLFLGKPLCTHEVGSKEVGSFEEGPPEIGDLEIG